LCRVPGFDLALTTNGIQFAQQAEALLDAGVRRVNFGIPSLDPAKYCVATRHGNLSDALDGLESAIRLGFSPIKINVVVMRGINDGLEDLRQFAALASKKPVHVRFIEYMPIGDAKHNEYFVPSADIEQNLKALLTDLAALPTADSIGQSQIVKVPGAGPAKNACQPPGWAGSIATISPMTGHICGQCNRLRLTADGHLRPCLFSKREISLKPALRPAVDVEHLKSLLLETVANKPPSMFETSEFGRKMSQIGG
jgi:cyclic pyranopterin phosphate synthase